MRIAQLSAIPADVFSGPHLGAILGVVQAGGGLGGAIGPFLGGWLFDVTGSYGLAFLAAAVAIAGSARRGVARRPARGARSHAGEARCYAPVMTPRIVYEAPRVAARARRDRRHQHLRPQLRRPLRRQRARARRHDRQDQHRPAQVDARDAAAARVRARLRPGRAHEPSRSAHATRCGASGRAARASSSRSAGTRRSTRSRAQMRRVRDTYGPGGDPRLLALGQHRDAAQPREPPAPALHVRRLHGALVEPLGGGRGLRGARDVRPEGGLQERGPRADRLRELAAHRHVGLEPGRRPLRHRHAPVPEAAPSSTACASSASIRAGRARATRWPTSTSSSARRPTPRR